MFRRGVICAYEKDANVSGTIGVKNMNKTFRVTFNVYGVFTHGKMAGKTNPKAHSLMTFFGDTVKECISKMQKTEAFYTIFSVEERVFTGANA